MRDILIPSMLAAATVAVLWFLTPVEKPSVVQRLYESSVTVCVKDKDGEPGAGSGSVILRTNAAGQRYALVLTAMHVVQSATNIHVTRQVVVNGQIVGTLTNSAFVLRWSHEDEHDLALLQIHDPRSFFHGVEFTAPGIYPPLGTPVIHIGSFKGPKGDRSVSEGIVSGLGRVIGGVMSTNYFDQVTALAYPGSSGGGVFLQDGRTGGRFNGDRWAGNQSRGADPAGVDLGAQGIFPGCWIRVCPCQFVDRRRIFGIVIRYG